MTPLTRNEAFMEATELENEADKCGYKSKIEFVSHLTNDRTIEREVMITVWIPYENENEKKPE